MDKKSSLAKMYDNLEKRQRKDCTYSQYYNKNGELLILLLKDYGTGWSSQCSGEEQLRLASDSDIVDLYFTYYFEKYDINMELEKDALMPAKLFFTSSAVFPNYFQYDLIHKLLPHFVLKGKMFQIREYDGLEKIYYFHPSHWLES